MTQIRIALVSWLDGPDVCAFCEQTYAFELEARCEGCDDGLCPLCADAAVPGEVPDSRRCSACAAEAEG